MKEKFIEWFTAGNSGYAPAIDADGKFEKEKTQHMWEAYQAGLASAEAQVKQLAAENALKQEFISTCFRAAGEGGDMDGNDIQELGERLGLFERQTYQPALHGYICGHEAGEDSVYVLKASPATDAILASLRAEGVEMLAAHHQRIVDKLDGDSLFDDGVRQHSAIAAAATYFAAQLRSKSAISSADDAIDIEPFGFVRRSGDLVVIDVNGDPHIKDGMPVFVRSKSEVHHD